MAFNRLFISDMHGFNRFFETFYFGSSKIGKLKLIKKILLNWQLRELRAQHFHVNQAIAYATYFETVKAKMKFK